MKEIAVHFDVGQEISYELYDFYYDKISLEC